MKYLIGFLVGFCGSALLYHPTHKAEFPELGRYTIGAMMIALSYSIDNNDDSVVAKISPSAVGVGCGVALARVVVR